MIEEWGWKLLSHSGWEIFVGYFELEESTQFLPGENTFCEGVLPSRNHWINNNTGPEPSDEIVVSRDYFPQPSSYIKILEKDGIVFLWLWD